MTKAQRTERDEAIVQLRAWIKPGDTVYTILDSVSRSGMSRQIRVVLPYTRDDGTIDHLHPNHAISTALGIRQAKRGDGLIIGGCGMDMGFHLVYELSHALYGDGYPCLGKGADGRGKCPSNYHNNHRDRVRCDGFEGRMCWRPDRYSSRFPVPGGWPVGPDLVLEAERAGADADGPITVRGPLLACLHTEHDGAPYEVCPTCKGAGELPNPEGPERWDLVHQDGYSLRHRWL